MFGASMTQRIILLDILTPYPAATRVVLYADSWERKIGQRTDFRLDWISTTLSRPACVVRGTTNAAHWAFLSHDHVSLRTGSPLVVFVSGLEYPHPVVSVGFRRDFQSLTGHNVLWSR